MMVGWKFVKVRNTLQFVTKNGLPLNPSSGIPTEKEWIQVLDNNSIIL